MSDPTEMVITAGFVTAAVVFAVAAVLRYLAARKPGSMAGPEGFTVDGTSPCAPPEQQPELAVGRVPVWFYQSLDLFGVMLLFLLFSRLVLASLAASKLAAPIINPVILSVNIGFQFLMAGLVVAAVVWRVRLVEWLGLRWQGWPWLLLISPVTVGSMWMVFGGLEYSGYLKWMESLGLETVQDTVKLFQEAEDPLVIGLMAFTAVIAAPLCEEVVFRGYFYPVLKKFGGTAAAVFCSSLVFAAAHGSVTALLPLFIFGVVLVFLYEKTGSLWAPIATHFCFNSATVIVQLAARYSEVPLDPFQ